MKILVIGSGGREHALAWKLRQSPRVTDILCAPGNAGTARVARNIPVKSSDIAALVTLARQEQVGLTVVGPDDALAAGIVDSFQNAGLRVFGPTREAARFEWSKVFAKEFMQRHGIPTAASGHFSRSEDARGFMEGKKCPLVIKADGLALGKGVVIAASAEEAEAAIASIMDRRQFGDAGSSVVIEEFLEGQECSIHALVDGSRYLMLPSAQDHKRIGDGDTGPNTGGMGTFSPASRALSGEDEARVRREILEPFMAGLRAEGIDFRGLLFPGLMMTADGPKVLEFNCRFGDPETQSLMPRLRSDLLGLLEATIDGTLGCCEPDWDERAAVCVVMASGGYPGPCETGREIHGLGELEGREDVVVFHAGTREENGRTLTAGGRVLGVTALGLDLAAAREHAYAAVSRIRFEGAQFRRDIARKGLPTQAPGSLMRILLAAAVLTSTALAQVSPVPEIMPPPAVPVSTPLPVTTPTPAATPSSKPQMRPAPPPPEASPTPTVEEKVSALSAADAQAALEILKQNYLEPAALGQEEQARALVQGLLQRLGPGVELMSGDAGAKPEPSPFRFEILEERVGYVRLGALTPDHLPELDSALASFAAKKFPSLILDLRATPQSSAFDLAAEVAKRFCPRGKTLFTIKKPAVEEARIFTSTDDPKFQGVIAVLVDSGTAGAPEVIAAVLRTHARALVVGAQTTGQAVEYAALELPSGSVLRVATAEVRLPGSAVIFPNGVKPDLVVETEPRETRRLLHAQLEKGVGNFVYEKERPRMNEAALVAGTNPEFDAYAQEYERRASGKTAPALVDRALQRALDLITSITIFDQMPGAAR